MSSTVSHSGIVQDIIDSNNISVLIISQSACSSCSSKKICSAFEMQEKIIIVKKPDFELKNGDEVNVVMQESFGYFAVIVSYILPFILMMTVLLVFYLKNINDIYTGLAVIVFLTTYYIILYLFRKKISKKAIFKIERL